MSCDTPTTPNVPAGTTAVEYDAFLIDRTLHLSGVLPGSGVYTSQDFEAVPRGTKFVTYWIAYTRGGAGGYPAFHHETTNGTDTEVREPLQNDGSLSVVQPNGSVDVVMEEIDGPAPADAVAIKFYLRYELPDWATGARLLVAEEGNTASPGSVVIGRTGSGGT